MVHECEKCPNVKLSTEGDSLEIDLDPGARSGHSIRFFEEGEPFADGTPGDLIFKIVQDPHPRFRRDAAHEDNLGVTVPLSLTESLVGFRKHIIHLDGRKVEVSRRGVTVPGDVMVIPGEGMPRAEGAGKGDLRVTFTVTFP